MCNDDYDFNTNVDLRNNLYVYNNQSYPARLRKVIREKILISPELVGMIYPTNEKPKDIKKNLKTQNLLRILLNSGVSANIVRAKYAHKKIK